jgi:hypothetical protein
MRRKITRGRLAAAGLLAAVAAGGTASIAAATSGGSGSTTTGMGTVAVKVTRPNGKTRTRPQHPVGCSTNGGNYVLRFARRANAPTRKRGRAAGTTLTVSGYHGPGSYTGTLRVVVRGPFLRLSRTIKLPVTLTSSGGQATLTRTLPGTVHPSLKGKTVSATASWTCTP